MKARAMNCTPKVEHNIWSIFQATAGTEFARSAVGVTAFGALSGGIGAELSGDDFGRGAGTGATIGLLN